MPPHFLKLRQIEGGGAAAGSGGLLATYTPKVIPAGQTFTVPENAQVLFAVPIVVEGDLILEGDLVDVD